MYYIYGKEGCIFCVKAKKLLDRLNEKYAYIDIEEDEQAKDFVRNTLGASKVPQIFKGVHYLGGYTELVEYVENNQ